MPEEEIFQAIRAARDFCNHRMRWPVSTDDSYLAHTKPATEERNLSLAAWADFAEEGALLLLQAVYKARRAYVER